MHICMYIYMHVSMRVMRAPGGDRLHSDGTGRSHVNRVRACMRASMHAYVHICIHDICIYACMQAGIYAHADGDRLHLNVTGRRLALALCACLHTWIYACIYAHVYTYIYIYINTYKCIHAYMPACMHA